MSILKVKIPGVIAAPQLGKFSVLPNPGNKLYAGYLFGTDYSAEYPDGTHDWSGNGRHATLVGGPVGAKAFGTSFTHYVQLPFTGDQLAAGADQCSWLFFCKAPLTKVHVVMSNINGTSLGTDFRISDLYEAYLNADDGPVLATAAITQLDAERGNRFQTYACNWSRTGVEVYTRAGNTVRTAGNPKADGAVGGALQFTLGRSGSYSTPTSLEIAAAMAYKGTLTLAERNAAHVFMQRFFARYGVAI